MKNKLGLGLLLLVSTLVPTVASAGGVNGRISGSGLVGGRDTDQYRLYFEDDEVAVIHVDGDHDTDLDCYAETQSGRILDSDVDYTDMCRLRFVPPNNLVILRIVNRGRMANRYTFQTN